MAVAMQVWQVTVQTCPQVVQAKLQELLQAEKAMVGKNK